MVIIREVRAGPGGLVTVSMRDDDGTIRRFVLPPHLAGAAEIEWSAQAVNMLAKLPKAPT